MANPVGTLPEGDEAQAAPLPEGEAEQAMPQPERGAHAAPLPEEQVRWLVLPRQTSILQVSDVSFHQRARALLSVPEQAEMTTWLPGLLPGLRPTEEGAQLPASLPAEIDQGRGRDPARQGGQPDRVRAGSGHNIEAGREGASHILKRGSLGDLASCREKK